MSQIQAGAVHLILLGAAELGFRRNQPLVGVAFRNLAGNIEGFGEMIFGVEEQEIRLGQMVGGKLGENRVFHAEGDDDCAGGVGAGPVENSVSGGIVQVFGVLVDELLVAAGRVGVERCRGAGTRGADIGILVDGIARGWFSEVDKGHG